MINAVSEQKLEPMFKNCATIADKLILNKGKDKSDTKRFKGGRLFMRTAGSAKNLSAISAKYMFIDEADRMLSNVDGEGDPIGLAEIRTSSYGADKKIFIPATPTVKGASLIEREFLLGDQRYFFLPCPFCSERQHLEWENLVYNIDENGVVTKAEYRCKHCRKLIEESYKTQMLEQGEWLATAKPKSLTRANFHINSMYSPVGFYSWLEMAQEYEKSKNDENLLTQFYNTKLGLTYELQGDSPPWRTIYDRREDVALCIVPQNALFLTAGIDTQPDRLEYQIIAWAKDKQNCSIDYGIIDGSPDESEVWTNLEEVLARNFQHESGHFMNISIMAIDTGGRNTQSVYQWCLKQKEVNYGRKGVSLWGTGFVMPLKGRDLPDVMIPAPNRIEVNGVKNALRLWTVGVSAIKREVYAALKVELPTDGNDFKPRTCHFSKHYDEEYFKQLTSEKQMIQNTKTGGVKIAWVKDPSVRNEVLDTYVYARAAAHIMGLDNPSKNWRPFENKLKVEEINPKQNPTKKSAESTAEILKRYQKNQSLV